jgi:hypothetical protein
VQTRRQLLYQTKISFLSHIEPNSIKEACKDENLVNAMNEELDHIEKKIKLGNWFQDQKIRMSLELNGCLKTK